MVLFISSCAHDQVAAIVSRLQIECRIINPLEACLSGDELAVCFEDGRIFLRDGLRPYRPDLIYWNSSPRTDAATPTSDTKFVATYRSRLTQFFADLSQAFADVPQMPGPLAMTEAGESKIALFAKAEAVGLRVPTFTWNAIGRIAVEKCLSQHGRIYRKVLGPPHVVSEAGDGITTTNLAVSGWSGSLPGASHPWQYQEIIPFVAQWRCQVVGKKIWATRWEHSPVGDEWDLRYHQEVLGERAAFKPARLDPAIARRLVKLIGAHGLHHTAPEFLETAEGEMIFIDLNPCGDWLGFFGEKAEEEIASALAIAIVSQISRSRV